MMRRTMKKTSTDKSILFVTYIMVGLFVGLMGYFGYFLQVQSETVINNSYNARLATPTSRIIHSQNCRSVQPLNWGSARKSEISIITK